MLSLVIPFHSDFPRVIPTLSKLAVEAEKWSIKEILLCHNGSDLAAISALEPEVAGYTMTKIKLLHTAEKGIGAAYRLGIQNASEPFVVLSASDLPFGFSDLKSFFEFKNQAGAFPQIAVGSKLHSKSDIGYYPVTRKVYSHLFYLARLLILGRGTPKDSQGTVIGSTKFLNLLLNKVRSQDYFFSLELLSFAIADGATVVELPIILENHDQESSVAPVSDGSKMFFRLFNLRQRLRKSPETHE